LRQQSGLERRPMRVRRARCPLFLSGYFVFCFGRSSDFGLSRGFVFGNVVAVMLGRDSRAWSDSSFYLAVQYKCVVIMQCTSITFEIEYILCVHPPVRSRHDTVQLLLGQPTLFQRSNDESLFLRSIRSYIRMLLLRQ
jgi:hypothetical protein